MADATDIYDKGDVMGKLGNEMEAMV